MLLPPPPLPFPLFFLPFQLTGTIRHLPIDDLPMADKSSSPPSEKLQKRLCIFIYLLLRWTSSSTTNNNPHQNNPKRKKNEKKQKKSKVNRQTHSLYSFSRQYWMDWEEYRKAGKETIRMMKKDGKETKEEEKCKTRFHASFRSVLNLFLCCACSLFSPSSFLSFLLPPRFLLLIIAFPSWLM